MQTRYLTIIETSGNTPKDYQEFCIKEKQFLEKLLLFSEYSISHKPNQYFSRFMPQKWKADLLAEEMQSINKAFAPLDELEWDVIVPKRLMDHHLVRSLPIVIRNVDLTDNEAMGILLFLLAQLCELDIQTFIIAQCLGGSNELLPNGIRISKQYLQKAKEAINNDTFLTFDTTKNQPIPCFIEEDHLLCFDETFTIIKNNLSSTDEKIEVLLLLWRYSTERDYEAKQQPLSDLIVQSEKTKEILMQKLKDLHNPSQVNMNKLNEAIHRVVEQGETFSDQELNKVFNQIINKSVC